MLVQNELELRRGSKLEEAHSDFLPSLVWFQPLPPTHPPLPPLDIKAPSYLSLSVAGVGCQW
jgi:hypothetical protein